MVLLLYAASLNLCHLHIPYVTMGTNSAFNIACFDGKCDLQIWQQKMKAIRIKQKVFKAIDQTFGR